MLATLNDVLYPARKNGYAVGLFNTVTLEMARGVLAAAEALRSPVIIGTASCSTQEVIDLSQHAGSIGADAVMVVNPFYAKLSDERIYQHYRQIAENSPLPVLPLGGIKND